MRRKRFDDKHIFPCCFVFLYVCIYTSVLLIQVINFISRYVISLHAAHIEESPVMRWSQHSCSNGVVSFIHPLRNVITSFSNPFPFLLPSWPINHTTAHLPSEQELVEWNISLLKVLRLHCNDLLLLCEWVAFELSLLLENKVFSDTKPDCNLVSS